MKKLLLVFAALFIGLSSINAQSNNEPIVIEKGFLGHKYYQGGRNINKIGDMKAIVANDEWALKEMKKAGVANGFSGVVAIGLGLSVLAESHIKKGATIYNESLGKVPNGDTVQLEFGLTPGGVGLTLSF